MANMKDVEVIAKAIGRCGYGSNNDLMVKGDKECGLVGLLVEYFREKVPGFNADEFVRKCYEKPRYFTPEEEKLLRKHEQEHSEGEE